MVFRVHINSKHLDGYLLQVSYKATYNYYTPENRVRIFLEIIQDAMLQSTYTLHVLSLLHFEFPCQLILLFSYSCQCLGLLQQ